MCSWALQNFPDAPSPDVIDHIYVHITTITSMKIAANNQVLLG